MSDAPALAGLDDVKAMLAADDPDGRLAPCELADLVIGPGVLARVVDAVAGLVPADCKKPASVVLLVDATPIHREGADVKAIVEQDLASRFDVRRVVLSDGHSELHVTDKVVQVAIDATTNSDVVVALGGGTVSDIGKLAVAARPGLPLVTVMTAASVDGYTDNVSVMLKGGVKRTVPSVWPNVVVADAETVAGAPARMNRAGYGEMTSMYVAPADWRLAAIVGVDPSYHRAPVALLAAIGGRLDACAPGVRTGDPHAVQELTWALAVRGIATGVAGTTACLSGVEHLVSHMLDLRAAELHLPTGLHGEQVGVGSVVAACMWELLRERLEAVPGARVQLQMLDAHKAEARVRAAFARLDPSGRIADECWNDYGRKLERITQSLSGITGALENWESHADDLAALVRPSRVIVAGLRSAGAPARLDELGADVDAAAARWAVESCALMRDRFTVVDVLTLLGWWESADVDEIFDRVDCALAFPEAAV